MTYVKLKPASFVGEITVPPSKSAAHRALICSFLSGGGIVNGIISSDDMKATRNAVNALRNGYNEIDCIESGSTLRFMLPIAAALGREVTFTGKGKLPERPIGEYLRLFALHGVKCETEGGLPLKISGKLTPGKFEIAGDISSQYITGLLLALPLLDNDSEIVLTSPLQSKPYVDMTVKVMSDFGVEVIETENGYFVKGNQVYGIRDYTVEGDWSQAAFFLAGGALFGDIKVKGLDINSSQGDKKICELLERFGAKLEVSKNEIRVKKSELKGIEINARDIPDTVPTLAVLGAYAKGKTVIKGAERLRLKESDRISSILYNLGKMEIKAEETPDGMIITGGEPSPAELSGFNDHRIVMAFCIAALGTDGECTISDALSINKSYPSFYEDYNSLGGEADVISDR